MRDDLVRTVAASPAREEQDRRQIVAAGDQRKLFVRFAAPLWLADVGGEPVAQASPADGVLQTAALGEIAVDRFGWAAIVQPAARRTVRAAQIAEVADADARVVLARHAFHLDDLERIARR